MAPTVAAGGGGGPQVSVVVAGVVGVVVGVAIVVAVVVTCRARRGHASSPGKSEQYHHSKDSLLELPQGSMYQTCTRHPSRGEWGVGGRVRRAEVWVGYIAWAGYKCR